MSYDEEPERTHLDGTPCTAGPGCMRKHLVPDVEDEEEEDDGGL